MFIRLWISYVKECDRHFRLGVAPIASNRKADAKKDGIQWLYITQGLERLSICDRSGRI